MFNGGFFRGKSFKDNLESHSDMEYFFAIVWGELIVDPKVQVFNKRKTSFTLKFHTNSFINVVIWGETEAAIVASVLEKGDMVLCCGTVSQKKYIVQKGPDKGKEKVWTDLNPQILIPMTSIGFLIAAHTSEALNKLIDEGEIAKGSDALESAGDYEAEQMSMGDYEVTI